MKRNLLKLAAALGFAAITAVAHAQSYSLDWFTIDGGGGSSAGGAYSLSGTIGQPDAGAMAGANFTITGGYWSLLADPTAGVPTLFITRSGANAIILWTPGSPGFVLQRNSILSAAGWADAPSGTTTPATVPATGAARFYRLRK